MTDLSPLESEIKQAFDQELMRLAIADAAPSVEEVELIRVRAAANVARKAVAEGMSKTLSYCQILKRNDGYIPWSDVKRYNREFKDNL